MPATARWGPNKNPPGTWPSASTNWRAIQKRRRFSTKRRSWPHTPPASVPSPTRCCKEIEATVEKCCRIWPARDPSRTRPAATTAPTTGPSFCLPTSFRNSPKPGITSGPSGSPRLRWVARKYRNGSNQNRNPATAAPTASSRTLQKKKNWRTITTTMQRQRRFTTKTFGMPCKRRSKRITEPSRALSGSRARVIISQRKPR
mmetsp:Transcript_11231/g.23751  ORF Transcript_11231/g.23751 Transcript_11231/m.23751 type:complete len:202 (+) Transcript_11231:1014-1619(+)